MMGRSGPLSVTGGLYICLCAFLFLDEGEGRKKCVLVDAKQTTGNGTFCKCKRVGKPPWADGQVKPAISPQHGSLRFIFERRNQPLIQWEQRGNYESGRYVYNTSFYLEIGLTLKNFAFGYNCNVEKLESTRRSTLTFYFDECCKSLLKDSARGLKSGDLLDVKIHARPMYNVDDKPTLLSISKKVPGRKKTKMTRRRTTNETAATISSNTSRSDFLSDEEPESNASDQTLSIVLTALVTLFVCTAAVLGIAYRKTRRSKRKKMDAQLLSRKVLVISNEDETHLANAFVEILKKYGADGAEIITSVRKTSQISNVGIIHWVTENITRADVVIFILTNSEKPCQETSISNTDKLSCSHVEVALGIAESSSLNIGIKSARKKFIAFDITNAIHPAKLPCCTLYTIEKGLKKLLKHTLGQQFHLSSSAFKHDLEILQKFAATADVKAPEQISESELNDLASPDSQTTADIDDNSPQVSESNDLDCSILYSHAEDPSVMASSAVTDQHHSIENNEVDPIVQ